MPTKRVVKQSKTQPRNKCDYIATDGDEMLAESDDLVIFAGPPETVPATVRLWALNTAVC